MVFAVEVRGELLAGDSGLELGQCLTYPPLTDRTTLIREMPVRRI
jgi:hypothetical protein